jgi:hypothetical protein
MSPMQQRLASEPAIDLIMRPLSRDAACMLFAFNAEGHVTGVEGAQASTMAVDLVAETLNYYPASSDSSWLFQGEAGAPASMAPVIAAFDALGLESLGYLGFECPFGNIRVHFFVGA